MLPQDYHHSKQMNNFDIRKKNIHYEVLGIFDDYL